MLYTFLHLYIWLFQDALERLLPASLIVVPKEKQEINMQLDMSKFTLASPVVIKNLPYSKKGVKVWKVRTSVFVSVDLC